MAPSVCFTPPWCNFGMAWSAGPLALALLLPARASAEFSCPVFEPAAVSEGDARYASKPVVDCAFKFIGGKAAGANSCRTPHITARRTLLASHRTRHAARNATRSAYHLTPLVTPQAPPITSRRTPRALQCGAARRRR